MKYLPLLLCLSSCCASPHFHNCGLDDIAMALPPASHVVEYKLFKEFIDGNPEYYFVLITRKEQKLLAVPDNNTLDFETLQRFIEWKRPKYTVALVHEDEELFNGEWTPMHFGGMRIWVIPKARNLHLVKKAA